MPFARSLRALGYASCFAFACSVAANAAIGAFTTVVIVHEDGSPVADATITYALGDEVLAVRSDANGRARLPSGAMRLRVQAPGCTARALAPSSPIVLRCTPPLIGRVTVATGSAETLHALPVAASALDATRIAASSATTSDALLRALPGFDRDRSNSMFTNYGQLRVSFAGAGNDRGLVLIDGIPAQDGFGGQIDWAAYPAHDVVRAELLRGPGSALYGAGAIGGVLALDTFAPTTAAQTTLNLAAGSHGFTDLYGRTAFALAPKLSASFSAAQTRLDYPVFPPAFSSPIDTAASAQNAMASLRVRYVAAPSTVFEYGYRGAWDEDFTGRAHDDLWRRLHQHAARVVHSSAHSTAFADYFVRDALVTNRMDQFPSAPGVLLFTQDIPTNERGLASAWTVDADRSTFELRADARFVNGGSDQFGPTGTFSNAGSGIERFGGLALQETQRAGRAALVAGLRGDVESILDERLVTSAKSGTTVTTFPARTDRAISPRIAARYDLTPHLAVRVSDGAGFRDPYLNELVRSFRIGPTLFLNNLALVPERSSSFVRGFDWMNARQELSFDVTHTVVNNAIEFRTLTPVEEIRSNFAQTQTDGQTLAYTRALRGCARLWLSGTAQNARVTRGDAPTIGKRLQFVPQTSSTLGFDDNLGRARAGVDVTYSGQTYADDLNTEPLGTAVIVGTHVALPLPGGSSLVLTVANLTNARYLSSIDRFGPPAVVSIGLVTSTHGEADAPTRDACR